jgi:Fe2+ or Zn2+ uptake regulation protein
MEPRDEKTNLQEVDASNTRRHGGGLEGLSRQHTELLDALGLKVSAKQESRVLSLLRSIMRIQKDPPVPLEFSQIYDSLKEENPEAKLTKAWVHRVLKSLVDMKLIRVESPSSYRKMYVADVNTILSGLEKLKEDVTHSTNSQIAELQQTAEKLERIDTKSLAQDLVESLTGKKQVPSSRFIKGLDEFHRVTENTMFSVAKPGDVIRTSVMSVEPYLRDDIEKRMTRIFTTAARGVSIRYCN